MAKDKSSFILYSDLLHTVDKLPDDMAGKLFKHILSYVNDLNPTTEDLIINIAFEPIKQQLKRDLLKYESICERNKSNGSKGGRPIKEEPKKPSWLSGIPKEPKKPDNDNDNGNGNDNDIKEIYDSFPNQCWSTRKTGKSTKNKEQIKKLLKSTSKDDLLFIIKSYVEDCSRTKTYLKNFSTLLNQLPDISQYKKQASQSKLKTFHLTTVYNNQKSYEAETLEKAKEMYSYNYGIKVDEIYEAKWK